MLIGLVKRRARQAMVDGGLRSGVNGAGARKLARHRPSAGKPAPRARLASYSSAVRPLPSKPIGGLRHREPFCGR